MTKKQLRKMFNGLIRENNEMMKAKLEKLLKSGAVDLPSWENNYVLPKLIMCAMSKEMYHQWKPLSDPKRWEREIKNFYHMM